MFQTQGRGHEFLGGNKLGAIRKLKDGLSELKKKNSLLHG